MFSPEELLGETLVLHKIEGNYLEFITKYLTPISWPQYSIVKSELDLPINEKAEM